MRMGAMDGMPGNDFPASCRPETGVYGKSNMQTYQLDVMSESNPGNESNPSGISSHHEIAPSVG